MDVFFMGNMRTPLIPQKAGSLSKNSCSKNFVSQSFFAHRYCYITIFLLVQVFIGCAPSIRYVRDSSKPKITSDGKYIVPGNWDYRKNYKVPQSRLIQITSSWIGTPYRFAGFSRKGIDCSGFVCKVFAEMSHVKLPHQSRKLRAMGTPVSLRNARPGDLVFFKGGLFKTVNHVGIYMGNNRFVHAATKKGVSLSSLDQEYYKERFVDVRRLF
jgi:hypothetical protein